MSRSEEKEMQAFCFIVSTQIVKQICLFQPWRWKFDVQKFPQNFENFWYFKSKLETKFRTKAELCKTNFEVFNEDSLPVKIAIFVIN